MKSPIYIDNHSTTRIDKSVLDAMLPYLTELYGNASSKSHPYGWMAEQAAANARNILSSHLNCKPEEVYFTSGTTESNHIALAGVILSQKKGSHVITSLTEHSSVLNLLRYFEKNGLQVTYLPVDKYGQIDLNQLSDSITPATILVTLMSANNEIGTIHPLKEIGVICRSKDVLFHTDAAQAIGKLRIDTAHNHIDLLSISAHKNYGPKGTGALYINKRVKLTPVFWGGGQEKGIRPGTLNIPGIAGLGKCIELSDKILEEETARLLSLRDKLYNGIKQEIDDLHLNGHPVNRLPNNLNISFPGIQNTESFLMELREFAFSTGAACSSGKDEFSHVLLAIGLQENLIRTSLRFGLGRFNTEEEIDFAIEKITAAVKKIRNSQVLL